MSERDADMKAELDERADIKVEPPEQSMAELRRRNAARTEVTITEWRPDGPDWAIAYLSCGHKYRVPVPFGRRYPEGTVLACEWCRVAKLKETP